VQAVQLMLRRQEKKRERQLKSLNEMEIKFKQVVDANKSFLKSQVGRNKAMTTEPDRKLAIRVNDDQKLGVLLGDYVKV
jgi:hypothetical protein